MSSRKSDIIEPPPRATPSVAIVAPTQRPSPWWQFLSWNGAVPLLIVAIWLIGLFVESPSFDDYDRRVVMLIGFSIILAVSLQMINGYSGQFSLGHAGFMAVGAYLAAYPAKEFSARLTDPFAAIAFYLALGICVAIAGSALLGLFLLIRESRRIHAFVPGVLMVLVFIWMLWDVARASRLDVVPIYFFWTRSAAWIQEIFAWVVATGVPPARSLSAMLPSVLQRPLSFIVLVTGAGCCAGAVGLIVGLPTLRLRGDYLAIATLGMGEIIRIVIQNSTPLGGALGLTGIPRFTNFAWLYSFALITILVIWRIAYSARGRMIMAVREDEIAAAAVGINNTRQKVTAFIIGAFFAGVAGGLFALYERSITPAYFNFQKSIELVVIVTLGGLGSISGAILAAIVLTTLPEVLRPVREYRMIIYSLLLIIMMLLRPQGLLGGRELWPKRRPFGLRSERDPAPTEDRREEAIV